MTDDTVEVVFYMEILMVVNRKQFSLVFGTLCAILAANAAARADLQVIALDSHGDSATYKGTGLGTNVAASVSSTNGVGNTTNVGTGIYNGFAGPLPNDTLTVTGASFVLGGGAGSLFYTVNETANIPGQSGYADLSNQINITIANSSDATQTLTFRLGGNPYYVSNFAGDHIIGVSEGESVTSTQGHPGGTVLNPVPGAMIQLQSFVAAGNTSALDPGSAPFVQYGPTETISPNGGNTDDTVYEPVSILGTGNFSIGEIVTVTIAAHSGVGFTVDTHITPEPATLAIWGCGLGLVGLVRHRRRKAVIA